MYDINYSYKIFQFIVTCLLLRYKDFINPHYRYFKFLTLIISNFIFNKLIVILKKNLIIFNNFLKF